MGVKMRVTLCLLFSAVCVLGDKNGNTNRRTKPFVADAVGNTLPPPSNVPATVGSPITLLTPDRYEFYTFDESGELVKRLMTLEEIQAIVAAGEESEGLVTFANDNQPTIALNFSQAPYTKVHSVVTNVQNVLKAQMEAHKNNPLVQPTLDTPDVSDTWSLILPSIFGNTGVDIVPEKAASSFSPETETFEQSLNKNDVDNSLTKEGGTQISGSTTKEESNNDSKIPPLESTKTTDAISTTTTTTSTTVKPTTTKKVTTKPKPFSTTTVRNILLTTTRPRTTTTKLPPTTKTAVTPTTKPATITSGPKTTTTQPTTKITKIKQTTTTTAPTTKEYISNEIPTVKPVVELEKISTFIPVSTVKYVTERTSQKPVDSTKAPFVYAPTTKRSPSTTTKATQPISSTEIPKIKTTTRMPTPSTTKVYVTTTAEDPELEKKNLTTVTTQSVLPSTIVSSTETLSLNHSQNHFAEIDMKGDDPVIPLFDVAQSISQIASDLGNNYQPLPTSSNLLDTNKVNEFDMESKEDLDMDIPSEDQNKNKNDVNFVKISTIDPHPQETIKESDKDAIKNQQIKSTTESLTTTEHLDLSTITSILSESTTIDPILTESMEDLLSQVVNGAPQPELNSGINDNKDITTEKELNSITTVTPTEITTEISAFTSSTEKNIAILEKEESVKVSFENKEPTKLSTNKETYVTTEKIAPVKVTIEKFDVPTEKVMIKKNITSHLSSELKPGVNMNEKIDDSKDFIQISASPISNSSDTKPSKKVEENKINNKDNNFTNDMGLQKYKDTESKKQTNTEQNENSNLDIVGTTTPKDEITINPFFENVKNKTMGSALGEKLSSSSTDNKDKNPDVSPKIEEFKKKIQKVNDEELANDRNEPWKLIPTVVPPKGNDISKDKGKPDVQHNDENKNVLLEFSKENQGLEVTTKDLGEDIAQFTELCNELAFRYWNKILENTDKKRSFVLSPYSITSMLAMMFMGAKGATSGEMNEILKLDDMVTFNPHFTLKNISDSIDQATFSGIAVSAFVRELFSDRNKGKILTFYKERAQHFYSGHVEEINFKLISDIIRRRTNLLVKKHTWGKIPEFMKTNSIVMKPPLAAFSTNIFQTDCTGTSVDGRDGEMYFVVSPNVRQRRLVPVPAVVYKSGFLAGYDPVLDATAAALGNTNSIVSTIFLMPGQQGNIVHADDLEKLENRLLTANPTTPVWSRVLRSLLPRNGLELQIPRFAHKSVFNVSSTLREMGLKELFDAEHADLGGLNGPSKDLYLSDMIQLTSFVTCGEGFIDDQHHIEEYPETLTTTRKRTSRWADWDEPRDYQRAFHDPHDVGEAMHLPLHLRPRQARVPTRSVQSARLKFDRPFLFFVRHNPSGMILYVGRYNPRLLP